MSVNVGDKAPSFSLYSSDKKAVSLKDYEGKNVVLLFFPLAFTSVCTDELCSMRDNIAQYNGQDVGIRPVVLSDIVPMNYARCGTISLSTTGRMPTSWPSP